eukprot:3194323-Rhodomonas_salina.2
MVAVDAAACVLRAPAQEPASVAGAPPQATASVSSGAQADAALVSLRQQTTPMSGLGSPYFARG